MTKSWRDLQINPDRFQANFEAQAAIGSTGNGGVHRPALSEAHLAVRDWFRRLVESASLEFHLQAAHLAM